MKSLIFALALVFGLGVVAPVLSAEVKPPAKQEQPAKDKKPDKKKESKKKAPKKSAPKKAEPKKDGKK